LEIALILIKEFYLLGIDPKQSYAGSFSGNVVLTEGILDKGLSSSIDLQIFINQPKIVL
jgi:hypothetical protein